MVSIVDTYCLFLPRIHFPFFYWQIPYLSLKNHSSRTHSQLTSPSTTARPTLDMLLMPSQNILFLLIRVTMPGISTWLKPGQCQLQDLEQKCSLSPGVAKFTEGKLAQKACQTINPTRRKAELRQRRDQALKALFQPWLKPGNSELPSSTSQYIQLKSVWGGFLSSAAERVLLIELFRRTGSSQTNDQGKSSLYIRF